MRNTVREWFNKKRKMEARVGRLPLPVRLHYHCYSLLSE